MNTQLEKFFRYSLSVYGCFTILGTITAFLYGGASLDYSFWTVMFPDTIFSIILLIFLFLSDSDTKRRVAAVKFGLSAMLLWAIVLWVVIEFVII